MHFLCYWLVLIGMVKISGLEDLSRFILPDTKVFNTFKLVLGEEVIEVSGPVISRGWFGKSMISAARCLSRRVWLMLFLDLSVDLANLSTMHDISVNADTLDDIMNSSDYYFVTR